MTAPHTVGIDVGATGIKLGIVAPNGAVIEKYSAEPIPTVTTDLVRTLGSAIADLRGRNVPIVGIGVGMAGLVQWPTGHIEYAANHSHVELALRERLARATRLPVIVDNDANAAAWGENHARPGEAVLFLAIGTGLGSGFASGGEVMRGPGGRGAELGHLVVDPGGEECPCGLHGCLETVASGSALVRWGRDHASSHPGSGLASRLPADGGSISAPLLIAAALAGEAAIVERVGQMGRDVGTAIARQAMSLYPVDRVVVGGGIAALGEMLVQPMEAACHSVLAGSKYLTVPAFSFATHGEDAVLVGAGLLAEQFGPDNAAGAGVAFSKQAQSERSIVD